MYVLWIIVSKNILNSNYTSGKKFGILALCISEIIKYSSSTHPNRMLWYGSMIYCANCANIGYNKNHIERKQWNCIAKLPSI